MQSCATEITTFCSALSFGAGSMLPCLWKIKGKPNFSENCLEQLTKKEVTVNTDYRLNYKIQRQCSVAISTLCPTEVTEVAHSASPRFSGEVLSCLKHNYKRIVEPLCQAAIQNVVVPQAQNIFMNQPMHEACMTGAMDYCCENIIYCHDPSKGGEILKCLKSHYDEVSDACKGQILSEAEVSGSGAGGGGGGV